MGPEKCGTSARTYDLSRVNAAPAYALDDAKRCIRL